MINKSAGGAGKSTASVPRMNPTFPVNISDISISEYNYYSK